MVPASWWPWMTLALGSYALGSIPFGVAVGKLAKGVDLRTMGSGNIGAANAWRILGPGPAILVLLLDAAKGWAPIALGVPVVGLQHNAWAAVAAGMAAILGHNYSMFLGFKGGKGVATSMGVVVGLDWRAALAGVLVWVAAVALTRFSSVGSLSGAVAVPILLYALGRPAPIVWFGVAAAAAVWLKHRENIARLLAGKELKMNEAPAVASAPDEMEGVPHGEPRTDH